MMRLVTVAGHSCLTTSYSALDNLLVTRGEILIDFRKKRGVKKVPQSFFFGRGQPNKQPKRLLCRPL